MTIDTGSTSDRGLISNAAHDTRDDRRRADASREESFRRILDALPEPILYVGRDHCLEFSNGRCEDWFGVDHANLRGRHVYELLGAVNRGKVQSGIDAALAGQRVSLDLEMHTRKGKPRTVEMICAPYFGSAQRVLGAVMLARDVSDRRRSEDSLRDVLNLTNRALAKTFAFSGLLSPDGVVLFVSKASLESIGAVDSDVKGHFLWETHWWEHSPRLQLRLQQAVRQASGGEYVCFDATHSTPGGNLTDVQFSLTPVKDSGGRVQLLAAEGRDLSSKECIKAGILGHCSKLQHRADRSCETCVAFRHCPRYNTLQHRAARQSGELAAIVAGADDAIISKSLNGAITSWNAAAERMFGYGESEALGQSIGMLVPPDRRGESTRIIERIKRGERIDHFETKRQDKQGRIIDVSLTVAPIRGGDGHIIGASSIARDVTERKRLHGEVVRVAEEEQRRIGQDLHDGIGQELTGVGLLAETLAKSLAREDHPEAAIAQRISWAIGQTLQRVRDMSRSMVPTDVGSRGLVRALQELASSVHQTQGIDCRFFLSHAVEIADAFVSAHLYRIAQEAIANALRHSQAEHIRLSLEQDGGRVRLEIRDDGVGLEEDRSDQHGVGLRTMRYRADLMDAELSIKRGETGGTQVSCSLSLTPGQVFLNGNGSAGGC